MTLRLRIITIVAAGLLLTNLALLGFGWIQEQLQQERIASLAQQAQASLWGQVLVAEEQQMDAALDTLASTAAFVSAARTQNSKALEKALIAQNLFPGEGQQLQMLAVLRPGQEAWSLGLPAPHPLLDQGSLELLFGDEEINGLRLGSGNIAMLISARFLPAPPGTTGNEEPIAIVAGRDLHTALQRLSQSGGLQASLLDLRGTLLASTAQEELWSALSPSFHRASLSTSRLISAPRSMPSPTIWCATWRAMM